MIELTAKIFNEPTICMNYPYCIKYKHSTINDLAFAVVSEYLYMANILYSKTTLASSRILTPATKISAHQKQFGHIQWENQMQIRQLVDEMKKQLQIQSGQSDREIEKSEAENLASILRISVVLIYKGIENFYNSPFIIKDFPFLISVYKCKTEENIYSYISLITADFVPLLEYTIAPSVNRNRSDYFNYGHMYELLGNDIKCRMLSNFLENAANKIKEFYTYLLTKLNSDNPLKIINQVVSNSIVTTYMKYIEHLIFDNTIYKMLKSLGNKFTLDKCKNINCLTSIQNNMKIIPKFNCNKPQNYCFECIFSKLASNPASICICGKSLSIQQINVCLLFSKSKLKFIRDFNKIKQLHKRIYPLAQSEINEGWYIEKQNIMNILLESTIEKESQENSNKDLTNHDAALAKKQVSSNDICDQLISLLTHQNFKLIDAIPIYSLYVQMCQLYNQIDTAKCQADINNIFSQIQIKIKSQKEIARYETISQMMILFAILIKNAGGSELLYERLHKLNESEKVSKINKKNIFTKCALLGIEKLWVEYLGLCQYNSKFDVKYYMDYIYSGMPFQIVDGENLYFLYQMLHITFLYKSNIKIVVISILGSDIIDKRLLTHMLGSNITIYDACSKSIFGSLIHCKSSDTSIILIDITNITSSTLSTYDRKMILFTLAISDISIFNCDDNTSQNTIDIMLDSLKSLATVSAFIPQPSIQILLNKATENKNKDMASNIKLMNKIEIIMSELCKNKFSKMKATLLNLHSYNINETVEAMNLPTLSQWLETSYNIYSHITKYNDITLTENIANNTQEINSKYKLLEYAVDYNKMLDKLLQDNTLINMSDKSLMHSIEQYRANINKKYQKEIGYKFGTKDNMRKELETLISHIDKSTLSKHQQISNLLNYEKLKNKKNVEQFISNALCQIKQAPNDDTNKSFIIEWNKVIKSFCTFNTAQEDSVKQYVYYLVQLFSDIRLPFIKIFSKFASFDTEDIIHLSNIAFLYSYSCANKYKLCTSLPNELINMNIEDNRFHEYIKYIKSNTIAKIQRSILLFRSKGNNPKVYMDFTIMALEKAGLSFTNEAKISIANYLFDPTSQTALYQPNLEDIVVISQRLLYLFYIKKNNIANVIKAENEEFIKTKKLNCDRVIVNLRTIINGEKIQKSIQNAIQMFTPYWKAGLYDKIKAELPLFLETLNVKFSDKGMNILSKCLNEGFNRLYFKETSFLNIRRYNKAKADEYLLLYKNKKITFLLTRKVLPIPHSVYFKLKILNEYNSQDIHKARKLIKRKLNINLFTQEIKQMINSKISQDFVDYIPNITLNIKDACNKLSNQLQQLGFTLSFDGYYQVYEFAMNYISKLSIEHSKAVLSNTITELEYKYKGAYTFELTEFESVHSKAIDMYIEDLFNQLWVEYDKSITDEFIKYIEDNWDNCLSTNKIERLAEFNNSKLSRTVYFEYKNNPLPFIINEFEIEYYKLSKYFQEKYNEAVSDLENEFKNLCAKLENIFSFENQSASLIIYSDIILEDESQVNDGLKKLAMFDLIKAYLHSKPNSFLSSYYSDIVQSYCTLNSVKIYSKIGLLPKLLCSLNKVEYNKEIFSLSIFVRMLVKKIQNFDSTIKAKVKTMVEYSTSNFHQFQARYMHEKDANQASHPICQKRQLPKHNYSTGNKFIYISDTTQQQYKDIVAKILSPRNTGNYSYLLSPHNCINDRQTISKDTTTKCQTNIAERPVSCLHSNKIKQNYKSISSMSNSLNIDIVFMVDCTRSMSSYRIQVRNIVVAVSNKYRLGNNIHFKFEYIGYTTQTSTCLRKAYNQSLQLKSEKDIFTELLTEKTEVGDIADSLEIISSRIEWSECSLKYVIHICNAGNIVSRCLNYLDQLSKKLARYILIKHHSCQNNMAAILGRYLSIKQLIVKAVNVSKSAEINNIVIESVVDAVKECSTT